MSSSSPTSSEPSSSAGQGQGKTMATAAKSAAGNINECLRRRAHRQQQRQQRRRNRKRSGASASASAPATSTDLLLVVLLVLCYLSLLPNRVLAQGTQDALVDSIGAATLAGEAANNAAQAADQAAAAGATASKKNLTTEAEKQAKIDRVLSFLSAGNIFVGNYEPYNRVVRRRVNEYVECRFNGTLTSRGVGIEESLPDVARLAFAFLADSKAEAADAALAAYARINADLADAGFSGLAAALNSASSDVSLSPIKFVLPQEYNTNNNTNNDNDGSNTSDNGGGNENKNKSTNNNDANNNDTPESQYLVEVRVVLRSSDAPHLELGASTALEAAVISAGETFAASSAVFELSPVRLATLYEQARISANENMLYSLVSDAAQLGVLLGPLDEYAPERRQQVTSAPDSDAFDSLAAAGGGRPSRLFAVVEVAASYNVCSGGLERKRDFVKIDEDGYDIVDSTTDPTGP